MKYKNSKAPGDRKSFVDLPGVQTKRSVINKDFTHKTAFSVGSLIPVMAEEVLPGSTYKMDLAVVARQSTLIAPTMDNAFIDTYAFFIPNRLVFKAFQQLMGENKDTAWFEKGKTYSMPKISAPQGGWDIGSLADYFGIPTNVKLPDINAIYFRAYVLVWNEWFRDQNIQKPAFFTNDDASVTGKKLSDGDAIMNAIYGGKPLPINKYADLYTKA